MEPRPVSTWHVVVPVKGGRGAKSRLRRSVDDEQLVAAIIHDTLEVVAQVVTPGNVTVVTSDAHEAARVRALGCAVVADPGEGLNAACLAGLRNARARGAGSVAVLLGDHPALTPDELVKALAAGEAHDTFFVPDAEGVGTALVGAAPDVEPALAFGPGSTARHRELGHIRLDLDLPGLRHDVDDEASLASASRLDTLGPRTRRALER